MTIEEEPSSTLRHKTQSTYFDTMKLDQDQKTILIIMVSITYTKLFHQVNLHSMSYLVDVSLRVSSTNSLTN